jgi:hypothetical protein
VIRGQGNSTSCFATLISPTAVFACEFRFKIFALLDDESFLTNRGVQCRILRVHAQQKQSRVECLLGKVPRPQGKRGKLHRRRRRAKAAGTHIDRIKHSQNNRELNFCVCIISYQVEEVTELQIPNLYSLSVWKIKPVRLEKNKFSPICLFNKDNNKDFLGTETYAGFKWKVNFLISLPNFLNYPLPTVYLF